MGDRVTSNPKEFFIRRNNPLAQWNGSHLGNVVEVLECPNHEPQSILAIPIYTKHNLVARADHPT
ncbi:MAG: hypothetical protein M1568_02620 [Acidobacteria bacterium]|nr:hypothetical protein [Acidobacteriota bacterium]